MWRLMRSRRRGIKNAVMAGVESIEHGHGVDREDWTMMPTAFFLIPTLGGIDSFVSGTRMIH
jgi:imidazolonepropionase-like amidohydrolase